MARVRHIHRRNVCPHGYEGQPCHPGNWKDVGEAACADTACPSVTLERHAYKPHKSGVNCTCGFGPGDTVHRVAPPQDTYSFNTGDLGGNPF